MELTALGFGLDPIRTLVSMATDSSRRVLMEKNLVTTLALSFLIGSSLFLQVTRTPINLGWDRNLAVSDKGLMS